MRRGQVWLWGHVAGAHDAAAGGGRASRVEPAEACRSLGVRNLLMVATGGLPRPPLDAYARSLTGLDRLVWSVLSDGVPPRDDHAEVLDLARERPDLVGGIVDDTLAGGRVTPDHLARISEALHAHHRRLDLWGVLYDNELERPVRPWLEHCDVVTLWTARAEELVHLEDSLARFATLLPDKRRLLGVYLWDFPGGQPVPAAVLEKTLRAGAASVDRGLLEGVILLATSLCGLGLESESIARAWLAALPA